MPSLARVGTHKAASHGGRILIQDLRREMVDESGVFLAERVQFERPEADLPTGTRGKPRVDDRRVISFSFICRCLVAVRKTRRRSMVHARRCTTGSNAGRRRARGRGCFIPCQPLRAHPPAELLIDSSAVEAHCCAAGGKRMARPVCKEYSRSNLSSLHQRIPSQGRTLAKMETRASRAS